MIRLFLAALVWIALSLGAEAATISVFSTKSGTASTSGTSQSVTLPPSTVAGHRLACALDVVGSGNQSSFSWPAGWTVTSRVSTSDTTVGTSLAYKTATGSEAGTTITVTTSTSNTGSYFCLDIASADTSVAPTVSWSNATNFSSGTSAVSYPSVSPAWGSSVSSLLVINFNAYGITGTPSGVSTWSSGYTSNHLTNNPDSGIVAGSADRVAGVSTESPGNTTLNAAQNSRLSGTFAFKGLATGGAISIPMLGM